MASPFASEPHRGPVLDRKLLVEVLERALVAPDPASVLSGADFQAVADVVRARREEPFGLDPVAIELIRAILRPYFGGPNGAMEALSAIAREIAGSLFEDPVFHHRLRNFWTHLIEAAP
jgi:hypothetical protein